MKTLLLDTVIEIRQEPCNLREEDIGFFNHEMKKILKPVYLTCMDNAVILKDVVYKNFKIYDEDCLVEKLSFKSKLKRMSLFFSKQSENNSGIWIIDNRSYFYFHWFSDALPRLWIARKHINGHHILLPNEYRNIRYVVDSLSFLNFKYTFFNPLKKLSVKNLLLPGHLANTGNFNSQVMQEIRHEFLKTALKSKPFRRLYISRKKASFRRLMNEVDFEQLLKEFGFETIISEDLNLLEQIQLFSESSILLGVHGGGLTNMLFMTKNSTIIELRGENDNHNNCYFSLASAMGLNYYYATCKTSGSSIQTTHMSADIQKMRRLLELLIPA